MLNFLKKNQILFYVIALMLVVAGYLNYTSMQDVTTEVSANNIGYAQLVNSNITQENNTANNVKTSNVVNVTNTAVAENAVSKEQIDENENEEETESTSASATDSYFSKSKLERDTMYSQMIETYEKVLNGINSLETQKQSAAEEIKKINDTKNSIMIAENLITTKGFPNNVIFVNGESVSAIIGAEELKQEEISQIQNILARELKADIKNIHIAIK